MKTVLLIEDSDNGDYVYPLDEDSAVSFFQYLRDNMERGEKFTASVVELTDEEWAESQRLGELYEGL